MNIPLVPKQVLVNRGQRMTHCLVSDSGSMDDNDPFGERVFNERETVSCHDINQAFDNLVRLLFVQGNVHAIAV